MGMAWSKTALLLAFASLAAACSTFDGGNFGGGRGVNFADGSDLGGRLSSRDRDVLNDVFVRVMDGSAEGARAPWSGVSARGVVIPQEFSLANLKSNPDIRLPAARGLDLTHVVETELGIHVIKQKANIRTGPSTERKIAEVFTAGDGVDVVGKIPGQPWMLVAKDGRVRGYVHTSLVVKAPGTELELAGGPRRRPVLCREFTQRISVSGQTDEWTGAACDYGEGWRLAPGPREKDDELLGL